MILERRGNLWLRLISALVFRIPGRPAAKMAGFSHTEHGSGLDMLSAAERTPRRDLRAKYFQHALDELQHARLFQERARALAPVRSRAQAVLEDSGFILSHGIRGVKTLHEQLGELEFLAFVWIHERNGARQFDIYADLMREDPDSSRMFEIIAKDERFHIAYSRRELDQAIKAGQEKAVRWAVLRVRTRALYQIWLRFARVLGDTVAGVWLGLLYYVLVGPFSLIVRSTEVATAGFAPPSPRLTRPAEHAREQG